MRVLIACETSGIGRRAFAARGHDAWSCDIVPSEDCTDRHIICDIRNGVLDDGWDLIVAHPPCTRLCRAGRRWLSGPGNMTPPKQLPKGRSWQSLKDEFALGVEIFSACWNAPCARLAIENPVMHDLAHARMPADLPNPDIVQPYWFGEPAYKATGWYLRGLPALMPTCVLTQPERLTDEWKRWNAINRMSPGPERARLRSRSYPGMMAACAVQWGDDK